MIDAKWLASSSSSSSSSLMPFFLDPRLKCPLGPLRRKKRLVKAEGSIHGSRIPSSPRRCVKPPLDSEWA